MNIATQLWPPALLALTPRSPGLRSQRHLSVLRDLGTALALGTSRSHQPTMSTCLHEQYFAGNPLDRSITDRKRIRFLADILSLTSGVELLLTDGRSLCVRQNVENGSATASAVNWFELSDLSDFGIVKHGGVLSVGGGESFVLLHPVLLGRLRDSGTWRLAIDVADVKDADKVAASQGLTFQDLRALLPTLPKEDLAVAGQATALLQWHLMISMVESIDGQRALLGRPKSLKRPGVLTCLSGFIEQGESIEDAVRREVWEEAGIPVGDVSVLGSQPWPIGRGGSCEIMIGCVAKALDDTLRMDGDEMDEVRWVSREAVRTAVQQSSDSDSVITGAGKAVREGHLDFFIPPRWAIAHNLISTWASKPESWFSRL